MISVSFSFSNKSRSYIRFGSVNSYCIYLYLTAKYTNNILIELTNNLHLQCVFKDCLIIFAVPTTPSVECVDAIVCPPSINHDFCLQYFNWSMQNCRKTCGFCGGNSSKSHSYLLLFTSHSYDDDEEHYCNTSNAWFPYMIATIATIVAVAAIARRTITAKTTEKTFACPLK